LNRTLFLAGAAAAGMLTAAFGLAAMAADAPADAASAALMRRTCVGCHALETVTSQGRSPEEWSYMVNRMQDMGAQASDAEFAQIKAYLAKTYPAAKGG
jgi:mono/diheme cytochrome c family protein